MTYKDCKQVDFKRNFFLSSPEDMLINFLERGEERERERRETLMWERNINQMPLTCAQTED